MNEPTIEPAFDAVEILEQLKQGTQSRKFPNEAIAVAREYHEQMSPALIQCLEDAVDLAKNEEKHDGPTLLALCLLTEFRAIEAWPVIKELLLLPGDGPFDIVGDGIHEIVPEAIALLVLSELGGVDEVVDLAGHADINLYCRVSVAGSVCRAYSRGIIDRDMLVSVARQLLSVCDADHPDSGEYRAHFIANLLNCHCDELLPEIEELYARHLVDDWIVTLEDVHSSFREDKELAIQEFYHRLAPLDAFTNQLQHWAAYQPQAKPKRTPKIDSPALSISRDVGDIHREEMPESAPQPLTNDRPNVGRNAPCPCGSGKKFKKCCMRG